MNPTQLFDPASSTYTYLLVDEATREAVIIDPVDVQLERDLAALMYDAHETLTRVDPQNLQRFKDVLAFLREDLKRF